MVSMAYPVTQSSQRGDSRHHSLPVGPPLIAEFYVHSARRNTVQIRAQLKSSQHSTASAVAVRMEVQRPP